MQTSPESKWTKGPWKVSSPKPARFPSYHVIDGDGAYITDVEIRANNPATANAHLIAAAPDMYEALKGMLAHACVADAAPEDKDAEDHEAERRARAALSRAEGKE